jgi:hypothetical protein
MRDRAVRNRSFLQTNAFMQEYRTLLPKTTQGLGNATERVYQNVAADPAQVEEWKFTLDILVLHRMSFRHARSEQRQILRCMRRSLRSSDEQFSAD